MARNGSGTYTKAVSSFSPGGTITASDHNSLWDDIVAEITNSVAADGQTTMTGPLKAANGTAAAPTLTFASDPDSGWYRAGVNSLGLALEGSAHLVFTTSSATWNKTWNVGGELDVSATATFHSGILVSSTAVFSHPILVSGTATFTKGFIASATSTFVAPILCSGTATFTNGFIASATATFVEAILVSGTATFTKGFIASASCTVMGSPLTATRLLRAKGAATTTSGATLTEGVNIASVADQASGVVRFTFTNAMASANYTAIPGCRFGGGLRVAQIDDQTTTYVDVKTYNSSGSAASASAVFVSIP
jgi:hypothetical protein